MQSFWEKKHSESDGYWLSHTNTAKFLLDIHYLQEPKNLRILDVGIGQGHLVRHLVALGNDVACCDISLTALNGVKDIAKTYHTDDINSIPPVDLCICNLVFQHCTDNECMRIINGVNLSDTGHFTFQFAFLRDGEELNQVVKTNIENKTHYFRSKEEMLKIVSKTNKKIVAIRPDMHYYEDENFSWSIMVVSNK